MVPTKRVCVTAFATLSIAAAADSLWVSDNETYPFYQKKKTLNYNIPIRPYDRNLFTAFNAKHVIGPDVSSERIISRNGVKNVVESISWRSKFI